MKFEHAGENLVRRGGEGSYYLRAKVAGKCVYRSLRTDNLRIAKMKRNTLLEELREPVVAVEGGTVAEALEKLRAELCDRPNLAPKTREYNTATIAILSRRLPLRAPAADWSVEDAAEAWRGIARQYSASVANKALSALHRLAAIMRESGCRADDPTAKLARMPGRKKHLVMPGLAQMQAIIRHVRMQRKRLCVESSHMIALLAFSGMRHGESLALRWTDVEADWIIVASDGRNKTRRSRRVPVNSHLRDILEAIRIESRSPLLLRIHSPRRALKTACLALGIPPMRVHDLRHFFATWCIESGIDIPTVAKWLGHQDGGALCMRTYGHVRDDHSLASVKKLG
jgi:integrase